ncbi:hypothetical protein [Sulfurospirillum sp.]|uniref:hypothetical protein n=1 Tax=Sulfurospirillum sp. TaxID=2053622 RepID=UPI002FDC826C
MQSLDIKKRIRSELSVRIFQLLFCTFGFAISLLMLYSGWQKEAIGHGLIGILFFPFLFVIILIIKDLLRTTLVVVCDKGIARYTINYTLKVVQSEFLYFTDVTHYTEEEGFVDPHSPVSKKGYLYTTAWFNGNGKRFDIRHFREDEIEGYHLDKEAAQEAKKAFELFCARKSF